jgi:hypothetical protein
MFCSWLPSLVVCPFYIKKKKNKTSWTGLYNIPRFFYFPSKCLTTRFLMVLFYFYTTTIRDLLMFDGQHISSIYFYLDWQWRSAIYIYIYARPPLYIFWKHESHFLNKFTPFHTSMNLGFDFPRKKTKSTIHRIILLLYI